MIDQNLVNELLHAAAGGLFTRATDLLETQKVTVDMTDGNGFTAVHVAAQQGQAKFLRALIERFFAERTEDLEPIDGAPQALDALAGRMQIMVLSNIPLAQREARQRALDRNGMSYPIVANSGRKGGAVARLVARMNAPVVFIDDIPHNIVSVAEEASEVIRLHFVGDERLARLLDISDGAHGRHDTWPEARNFIEDHLTQRGY